MIPYPDIDPVLVRFGPLQVRWYGIMYILGFAASWMLVKKQIKAGAYDRFAPHFENLNFVLILSLVVGGRLGYILFYNLAYYLEHPLEIAATWHGGMSFHGGLVGLLLGGFLFCRRHQLDFLRTADLYIVTVPIGIGLGRLGNFINAELYGRITDVPWAMVFPGGGSLPRHPSQLYEAGLEGVLLFAILWTLRKRKWPAGSMLGLFLVLYGVFRWIVELFRAPDPQLGFVLLQLTMGQVLCMVMIAGGGLLLFLLWRKTSRQGVLDDV